MDDHGRTEAWEWRERALAAEAERDRLRVVVEAQGYAIYARNCYISADSDEERDAAGRMMEVARERLVQLDGSGDIGGVVPPVHGRGDRSTPHTSATGTDTVGGAQGSDPSAPESSTSEPEPIRRLRELGEAAAERATPSPDRTMAALQAIRAIVGDDELMRCLQAMELRQEERE